MAEPGRVRGLRRAGAALLCGAALAFPAAEVRAAQESFLLPERSPRLTDYRIRVRLLEDEKTLSGLLDVTWRNPGSVPATELRWHVYNNAWEHAESLWLLEGARHNFGRGEERQPRAWGSTEVSEVRLIAGGAPGAGVEDLQWEWVIQPEAPRDRTVARVALPKPVPPGGEVRISLAFTSVMPRAFRRSGWGENGYLHAVQWFPKLGVFEPFGGSWRWNCPPYHYLTEFYSDFGSYEVDLTLPGRYLGQVVATGSADPTSPTSRPDGTVNYLFRADDVHDFAWTADPEALILEQAFLPEDWRDEAEEARVAAALGLRPEQVRPQPVRMILLLQPEHRALAERYFTAVARSLYYFGLWYGSYPYPTITCVDPPHDAGQTGGMEYPRLFTGGTALGRHARTLSPEGVTVHEFGHQFWYGLTANDEFNHAWLDEGFNTFSTQRILARGWPRALATHELLGVEHVGRAPLALPEAAAGDLRATLTLARWESPELIFLGPLSLELRRRTSIERWMAEMPPLSYFPQVESDAVIANRSAHERDWSQPLATPTWALAEERMRGINAYRRPALTLETMARLMGEERWTRVLRAYHARTRFRHAQPGDLIEVVKEFAPGTALAGGGERAEVDWDAFWTQAYQLNDRLDFGVMELNQRQAADGTWTLDLGVRRYGRFRVPVEIRLVWEDGAVQDFVWSGTSDLWTKRIEHSPQRAALLLVDPERRLLLDRDWLNNARRAAPDPAPARNAGLRAWLWAQQLLHYAGGVG